MRNANEKCRNGRRQSRCLCQRFARRHWRRVWSLLIAHCSFLISHFSFLISHFSFLILLSSCYNPGPLTPDAWDLTERQLDSISFSTTHHYSQNYNFIVTADSLQLLGEGAATELGEEPVLTVAHDDRLVVADIQTVATDSVDSVWVKVARDQLTQGWVRESELLAAASPDDPISRFIDFFSNAHLLIFLGLLVATAATYGVRRLLRRNARLVHFNDVDSAWPTLLCVLVASSATLYAGIQRFSPESWRHFYYHPSLNPWALPPHLGLFVASVWAIIIVGLAAVDDVRRLLRPAEAIVYVAGLAAVAAVAYVVFSVAGLFYVGWPLLAFYVGWALWRWWAVARCRWRCGHCGAGLHRKGRCPRCGAMNV